MYTYFKIILWGLIWFWIWLVSYKFVSKKGKGNCLTWSVKQFDKKGGYLAIRWSRSNKFRNFKWPHFLWLEEKHGHLLKHYIPKDKRYTEKKTVPKPWFKGKIKAGDDDDKEN